MNIPTTPQEIFDFTTRKIIEQGGPSSDGHGGCRYRGPNSRKCAVGWLIPDDRYDANLEGLPVSELISHGVALRGNTALMDRLQTAHDRAARPADAGKGSFFKIWKSHLREVAEAYHLSPAVLSEIPEDAS